MSDYIWVEKGSALGIHFSESQKGGCIYYETKTDLSSTFEFETYGNVYNEPDIYDDGSWAMGHRLTFRRTNDWERAAALHVEICGSYIHKVFMCTLKEYIWFCFIIVFNSGNCENHHASRMFWES